MPPSQATFVGKSPPFDPLITSFSLSSTVQTIPGRPQLASSHISSLAGLENNIPPFQTFLRQTPPLGAPALSKPLPPTPLESRSSRESFRESPVRRTSSVYSQTVIPWNPNATTPLGQQDDHAEDVPVAVPFRSAAYSTSTPDLQHYAANPPPLLFLTPRTFSPLLSGPTISAITTITTSDSSLPPSRHDTMLLPPSPPSVVQPAASRRKIEMVSLDQAKQAKSALSSAPLLPEELRARLARKMRSVEKTKLGGIALPHELRRGKGTVVATPAPPGGEVSTLIDRRGQHRLIATPSTPTTLPASGYPFPTPREGLPSLRINPYGEWESSRQVGRSSSAESLRRSPPHQRENRVDLGEDYRVRTTPRARRRPDAQLNDDDDDDDETPSDLMRIPDDLPPYREGWELRNAIDATMGPRTSSAFPAHDSGESIRTHTKMFPQSLFGGKPSVRPSETSTPISSLSGSNSLHSTVATTRDEGSPFPLRYSPTPTAGLAQRESGDSLTTGMIPISAPNPDKQYRPPTLSQQGWEPFPSRQSSPRSVPRESKAYPHVMHRAGSKTPVGKKSSWWALKTKTKTKNREKVTGKTKKMITDDDLKSFPPGKPLLAADIIALRLQTPTTNPSPYTMPPSPPPLPHFPSSPPLPPPLSPPPLRNIHGLGHAPPASAKPPRASASSMSKLPFYGRVAASVVAIKGKKQKQKMERERKEDEDENHDHDLVGGSRGRPFPSGARATHTSSPAKALGGVRRRCHDNNDDNYGDSDVEVCESTGFSSKPSAKEWLLGSVVHQWEERKARKRREGLKRMIHVVVNVEKGERE